ncbi:APA family basic amino acid/polyamine antiporter [Nocardioides sp. BE266]|uniref:APC family permease n=1 Tax=Nocardioides sp. BE266 TaxID=2817725 RepID=UPI0028591471|nr:APC family permease [Nocardioides sp. BE266]MDR7252448.1 APA family basic amino acid/polyamine antiporter [Nocardioides sp. BE266]
MSSPAVQPGLARRLGTSDAVVVGLSAMLGAGVFVAFTPAAAAAGSGLLAGLGIAAVIAFCNAVASAQLASSYPSSGGTYLFGREVLGPWWGFLAGWGFVVGKTASCAAMAMTFAAYALPDGGWWQRGLAALAVVAFTVLNLCGVTRTATAAKVLLGATLLVLVGFLAVAATGDAGTVAPLEATGGVWGVLQAAGLLFFAFAGYARIATLAEEVRRPELLGRAILVALGTAVVVYLLVGLALVRILGADLPGSPTPIAAATEALGADWAVPLVRIGAAAAALGALLALLAGVGRTTLAMARERDLPTPLASVDPRHQVPDRAQVVIGVAVVALVLAADLRGAIGFSSFGVLVYYAVANLSALRQPPEQRRWPRALQVLGLVGCVVMAAALPLGSVLAGLAVFAVGIGGRLVATSR